MSDIKAIAFHLPQYHPIPENDAWWGKGFTEWTNVTKASPQFPGHYQPQLPADLGFYDLRLPEARKAQAELAKAYGIHGFCYYHYWFHGKRLLERPFNDILASNEPDFPFCLCWANETWSRRWLGEEKSILMKQTYSEKDDLNHIRWLIKAFSDHRYIQINDRPLFIIYRPLDLPNVSKTIELFRKECSKVGLPSPYLIGCNAHSAEVDYQTLGFDSTLDFQPQLGVLPHAFEAKKLPVGRMRNNLKSGVWSKTLKVYDETWARYKMRAATNARAVPAYSCVFVSWDNTARLGNKAIILSNPSVQNFTADLKKSIKSTLESKDIDEPVVFINAWNEWAEGNHLEPDSRNGLVYLEAVREALIEKH